MAMKAFKHISYQWLRLVVVAAGYFLGKLWALSTSQSLATMAACHKAQTISNWVS